MFVHELRSYHWQVNNPNFSFIWLIIMLKTHTIFRISIVTLALRNRIPHAHPSYLTPAIYKFYLAIYNRNKMTDAYPVNDAVSDLSSVK